MTPIDTLIDEVKASLASGCKFYTIDAETYYKAIGNRDTEFTPEVANQTARSLVRAVVSRYATVEEFERDDNGAIVVFVIATDTTDDWQVATLLLRETVMGSFDRPAEIIRHHVIDNRLDPES